MQEEFLNGQFMESDKETNGEMINVEDI